ncbi:MAG: selenide, water dikinase SelD [Flavobacteriales bacterium]|nr:MAG: selenide, water dikinase SelD [Flavobacteriales bacterium]
MADNKEPVRLTQHSHGAGCGCKIAPAQLELILKSALGTLPEPRLLVGYGTRDDAAVYELGDGRCIISTTDFFSPIVDDAFDFGRIAAVNALSDVYAMGGRPLLAVAVLGWPIEKLGPELAQRVVEGGRQACHDAGIPLAGGHSIDAPEPFFGLAVTGEVRKEHIKRNDTARPGDLLFLTKPLGVGILSTAMKRGVLPADQAMVLRDSMVALNSIGSQLGTMEGVHALTDVTGFGLLGHLMEMCDGSGLAAEVHYDQVPVLGQAKDLIATGCYPDGALRNWKSYGSRVAGAATMERMFMLADPETSGGLLISVAQEQAESMENLLRGAGIQRSCIGRMVPQVEGATITIA